MCENWSWHDVRKKRPEPLKYLVHSKDLGDGSLYYCDAVAVLL